MPNRAGATGIAAAVLLAGCGGGDPERSDQAGTAAPKQSAANERPAVESVVRRWIDDDACDLMSEKYAAEGSKSADEGRAACEEDTDPGIRSGEYRITGVQAAAATASATVTLNDGGKRTFKLVKEGKKWKIDGVTDEFLTRVGNPLRYRDSITVNDRPNLVDARVTVRSVKTVTRLSDPYLDKAVRKPGTKFLKVRVEVRSLSAKQFEFSASDFLAVTDTGEQAQEAGNSSIFSGYLGGSGNPKLLKGDRVVGFIAFAIPTASHATEIRLQSQVYTDAEPRRWTVS